MDYEKKYNEALERAKKVKHDIENIGCSMAPDMLEVIFPELAESEDERTRKEIINFILYKAGRVLLDKETEHRFVAYLERQKERRLLTKEEEYTLHRIIEYLEDETCPSEWISLLHDIYCLPYMEKQKEQKPAEKQMKALQNAVALTNWEGNLAELYEQLKKL